MSTPSFESPESSSPIVTRAVAASLKGISCENYLLPNWQRGMLLTLGAFPQAIARSIISQFQAISGLPQENMRDFSATRLVEGRLADYVDIGGAFPVIVIGAALGGASAYLSRALGGPFLPQAFVVTLKGGSPDGDVNRYLQRSLELARKLADENSNLLTIQHYDPIHDGWLTRYVNHLRFKLLDLPPEYANFIQRRLQPGGAVVYLDCGATWLRYRVGERSVFQIGGWGDVSPEEFITGSERIRAYARRAGLKHSHWELQGYPLERGAESEWGSEPGLAEALEVFCKQEGFRFERVTLPRPNDFSRLAYATARYLLEKEDRSPAGVVIEMFSQFDTNSAWQGGLLPLWLIFNTKDSLEFLKSMRAEFPPEKPVFFSPLATFSITPDLVEWEDWEEALGGKPWINIGTRSSHYPADARALVKWAEPLQDWVSRNQNPVRGLLNVEEIKILMQG